jgi:hypothetical protein
MGRKRRGRKRVKSNSRAADPPLRKKTWSEKDPATGGDVEVTQYKRGVFATEQRSYHGVAMISALKSLGISARDQMLAYADRLRASLERKGLPNDRTPSWMRSPGGEWRPHADGEPLTEGAYGFKRWTKMVEHLTEPLSVGRAEAELLAAIVDILDAPDIDKHLFKISKVMNAYAWFQKLALNSLAHQGVMARKARAQGPASKHDRATQTRRIVLTKAEHHWAEHPALRGDASNTAARITPEVNEELRSKALLPRGKAGLSSKTISDHIRAGIRG